MRRYGQIGWRAAAIAAFVGTAALAVVLTRAPAGTVTALSSEISGPACVTSGLEAWMGSSTGGAGSDRAGVGVSHAGGSYYTLEFTNISHQACRLYGYPEVSAYQAGPRPGPGAAAGIQLGGAASRDTSVRPRPVLLAPGDTAHAMLRVTAAAGARSAGCIQVTSEELRIMLPSQGRPAFVAAHIAVCAGRDSFSLSVQAIQARGAGPSPSPFGS